MKIKKFSFLILCFTVCCSLLMGCSNSNVANGNAAVSTKAASNVADGSGAASAEASGNAADENTAKLEAAYAKALECIENGEYDLAADYLESLRDYKDCKELLAGLQSKQIRESFKDAEAGDIITFGHYEQDNDLSNGPENIEWLVLEKGPEQMLVISRYALNSIAYNEKYEDVTWETSSARTWLNNSFYNTAFDENEKGVIILSHLEPAPSKVYQNLSAGNATDDHVFLLGTSEAEKYFTSREELQCLPTAYAVAQGAWTTGEYVDTDGNQTCFWWLRTPGNNLKQCAYVHMEGTVNYNGTMVSYANRTVRPAMWLDVAG